jgi:hypothetical protein
MLAVMKPFPVLALALAAVAAPSFAQKVDFVKDVEPIFKESCVKCHRVDPEKPKKKPAAKFRLDDKAAAFKGGRAGHDIVPGRAADSLLYKLLKGPVALEGDDKELDPMPKVKRGEKWKPLDDAKIEILKRWIDEGAEWPEPK